MNVINEFAERRVNVQIQDDGKLPSELNRTNAYSYILACLGFFAQFCIFANSMGYDIYSQNKQRFDAALRYVVSYINRHDEFPYQQINGWKSAKKN